MPLLDVIDQTFVVAPASVLRPQLCDERMWAGAGIVATVREDRRLLGVRWDVCGAVRGTSEIWLEQAHGGTLVHLFLQADPVRATSSSRAHRRHVAPVKRWILSVKRRHDMHRPAAVLAAPPAPPSTMDPHSHDPQES